MTSYLLKLVSYISNLQSRYRKFIVFCMDLILIPFVCYLVLWFQYITENRGNAISYYSITWPLCLIAFFLYPLSGQYTGFIRYLGSFSLYSILIRNFFLIFILSIIGLLFDFEILPIRSLILLWLLMSFFNGSIRFIIRDFLNKYKSYPRKKIKKILIYGAGAAGVQLAASIRINNNYAILGFIDDSSELWNRTINGIKIYSPKFLLNKKSEIDKVLIAIPSLNTKRRKKILDYISSFGIPVLQCPSLDELSSGKSSIDELKPIDFIDLLGRETIKPIDKFLGPGIKGSVICVTGAGGSIGSELCRQICNLAPSKLILFEISEPSLHQIYEELISKFGSLLEIKPVLGNANDKELLKKIFEENSVKVIFHAAAYKHVPMVEANPLAGLANNVLATRSVCEAAVESKLEKFVLISTDKAVRPTNVMGATKRLAELITQSYTHNLINKKQHHNQLPLFSIVRFGNVLGSSGSVVPLFIKQIAEGGPITLTHEDVIRYFMTIEEASLLVIQASVLSNSSGDVFLLDMGEPVLIKDLAEKMIKLSGLSIKDNYSNNGDIEIKITGLRSGEKLYEELLIDAKASSTEHPRIFKASENSISREVLWPKLDKLSTYIEQQNKEESLILLNDLVKEWVPYKETIN